MRISLIKNEREKIQVSDHVNLMEKDYECEPLT